MIEYQSASRFWFTTAAGAIFKRQADGSFAQVKAPTGVPLNDIEFSSGQIGFAVGNGGQLLRSTDGGNTWNLLPPQLASATDRLDLRRGVADHHLPADRPDPGRGPGHLEGRQ